MKQFELTTIQDLNDLEERLVNRIGQMLSVKNETQRKYLKSKEVRNLLHISPGTLANMVKNHLLNPNKIGGIYFFDIEEINKVLNAKY
jgi:hypothetical protein